MSEAISHERGTPVPPVKEARSRTLFSRPSAETVIVGSSRFPWSDSSCLGFEVWGMGLGGWCLGFRVQCAQNRKTMGPTELQPLCVKPFSPSSLLSLQVLEGFGAVS
jgi:hypothetical protein